MKALIGRKVGMTQVFAEDGKMYPVTVVEVLPNVITQIKTIEKDGYQAVQVGYEDIKESRLNQPQKGIFNKAGVSPKQFLAEIPVEDYAAVKVGDELKVNLFQIGDVIDVVGISKGKGFSGPIKRHGFKIGAKGHGGGYPHRSVGSLATIGRTNNRIHPGRKMPGHDGNQQATILNLKVVAIDEARNAILIKGGIPGPKKGLVTIRSAVKAQLGQKEVIKPLVDLVKAIPTNEVKE